MVTKLGQLNLAKKLDPEQDDEMSQKLEKVGTQTVKKLETEQADWWSQHLEQKMAK